MAQRKSEHILCVDDEEGILRALRNQLTTQFGDECEVDVALSAADALELMEELERDGEEVAVIVADQIMPGMKGVELLEEVHRRSPATTKILLTGQAGLDAVIAGINRAGLNHYIPKPWAEPDLRLAVENLLRQFRLRKENQRLLCDLNDRNKSLEEMNHVLEQRVDERTRELAEANARLAQLAVTDGLTGLFNHRHFHERLELEIERSARSGLPLVLFMIDVDHFKQYNDNHGHPAGDEVLRQVAQLLGEGRRVSDVVARYGGEEFAVALLDTDKLMGAQVAEKLRAEVAQHPFHGSEASSVTISLGVASFPDDAATAEALIRCADKALYRAKDAGRNRVVMASELST